MSYFPRHFLVIVGLLLALDVSGVQAQQRRSADLIPGGPSKSNQRILDLFAPTVAKAIESTVTVWADGKLVAFGAIVRADGFILTKDSEVSTGKLSVKLNGGKQLDATRLSSNEKWDLALLKVDAKDLKPVTWEESKVAPVGNFVATAAPDNGLAIGVVSVAARNMPEIMRQDRGYLGVMLKNSEDSDGVVLDGVAPKGPAEKVGLKKGDIIISVNGKQTPDSETLVMTVSKFKPGEIVVVRYRRDDEENEIKVTLDKRPAAGQDRGDFQNSMGTSRSERRTGFPFALQHDTDLKAAQCGGPLVDLEGRVIGINIARGGRTDTYAIPSESLKPLLADMLVKASSANVAALTALAGKIKLAEAAVRDAETQKVQAEKKLAEAKAALEKLQAEQKKEVGKN